MCSQMYTNQISHQQMVLTSHVYQTVWTSFPSTKNHFRSAHIYIYRCIRLCCGDASSATLATMANRAPHPHVWVNLLNDVLCRCVFYSIVSSNMCSIRTMRTWHTFRKSAKNRGTIGSRAIHKHAMREWTHTRTTQHTRDVKRWHRRWWWFIWHIR